MRPRKLGIGPTAARLYLPAPPSPPLDHAALRQRLRVIEDLTERLLMRDGPRCWYCGIETAPETRTVEHILAQSNGGGDDIANLCIACKSCNEAVGDQSIVAKVARRDQFFRNRAEEECRRQLSDLEAIYHREPSIRSLSPGAEANREAARIAAERREAAREHETRRQRENNRCFIDAARELLGRETYLGLWRRAEELLSEKGAE